MRNPISHKLLKTNNKGVHEQFDVMFVALTVCHSILISNDREFGEMSDKGKENVTKLLIKRTLNQLGYRTWLTLLPGLSFYAFQLFAPIYTEAVVGLPLGVAEEKFDAILVKCATYLDAQFESEGVADVISFIKGEPIE